MCALREWLTCGEFSSSVQLCGKDSAERTDSAADRMEGDESRRGGMKSLLLLLLWAASPRQLPSSSASPSESYREADTEVIISITGAGDFYLQEPDFSAEFEQQLNECKIKSYPAKRLQKIRSIVEKGASITKSSMNTYHFQAHFLLPVSYSNLCYSIALTDLIFYLLSMFLVHREQLVRYMATQSNISNVYHPTAYRYATWKLYSSSAALTPKPRWKSTIMKRFLGFFGTIVSLFPPAHKPPTS